MKVLLDVTPLLNRLPRGIGTYLLGLIEGFEELREKPTFYYGYKISRIKYLRRLKRLPRDSFSFPYIYDVFFFYPRKFDIFHGADRFLPRVKAKKVITVHDLLPFHEDLDYLTERAREKMRKRMIEAFNASPDAVIAVSPFTKSEVERFFPNFIERTVVIPHGVSPIFKVRGRSEVKDYLMKNGIDFPYLLFVGEPEPRKNVRGILEAFSYVVKSYRNLKLILVGRERESFPAELNTLLELLKNNVVILGETGRDFLSYLYSGAELFLFPSFYEGFGLPVLEAMASGTPVIISNHPSLRWVAKGAALIVDPDPESIKEGILLLLEDRELRQKLITLGLKRSQEFTWYKTALKTLKVYNKILTE